MAAMAPWMWFVGFFGIVVLALSGGLPIKVGNETIGAVGVSGTPGQDDVCAQAGHCPRTAAPVPPT